MSTINIPVAADAKPSAWSRVRSLFGSGSGTDVNLAPVIISLVVVAVVFQVLEPRFLSAANLSNLFLQITSTGTIAIGVVLVLLLGEIDLSVGSLSGAAAALLAALSVQAQIGAIWTIAIVVVAGALWGVLQGSVVVLFRLPAFVVTLAGLITLQGIQLFVLGPTTGINLPSNGPIAALTTTFFPPVVGWIIAVLIVVAHLGTRLLDSRRLRAAGLPGIPLARTILETVLAAVLATTFVVVFSAARGIPLAVLIFLGLIAVFDFIVRRTVFGKHILAVGGDEEAARRNGVRTTRVRITVFALASALAAFGGILASSRLLAATGTIGQGDVLINAIAAAVIGGTSLFGGRGTVMSALLGSLVIGAIANGMTLLNIPPALKFVVTGLVLLAAVIADALVRRRARMQ